jgi:hypothetical protein
MPSDSGGASYRHCHSLVESLFVTVGLHCNGWHWLDVTEVAHLVAHGR